MLFGLLGVRTGIAGAIGWTLLVGGISAQVQPIIPSDSREAWLALLHYKGSDGEWLSEVEDPSFFLDVEGPRNPEREWDANRRALLAAVEEGRPQQHAQCRFPARFQLMKEAFGWSEGDVHHVDCPDLAAHQRTLSAKSLSVVFVSHFLNNPASAFGHTMLYLGSDSERSVLLADYSVSFEADTEGLSPLGYIPRGLFGGLVAGFRLAPLHERVRRYEREEQRDLWLFPLGVSQEQIDQLVRHLWELKDVSFQYGFFGGNCAQKILSVVHAVAPDYEVLPRRSPAVLPSEVSRRLVGQIGLAGEPIHRPSLWSQYSRQVARLSEQEREQLQEMVASRSVPEGVSLATLTAALLWSEFETPYRTFRRAAETDDHSDLVWKRALWESRVAGEDTREDVMTFPVPEAGPSLLQAHRPSRITVGSGYRRSMGAVLNAGARWLLHEAVDPQVGYPPVSSIEVGRVDLGLTAAGEFFIDEATVVRVERLAPASSLQSALAWKFEVGTRRVALSGESPLHIGMEVGIGVGAGLLRPRASVAGYSMVGVRPGAALGRSGTSFVPVGIWSGGLLLRLPADFRTRLAGEYALSMISLQGGSGAFNAVVRKGLTQDWDLEVVSILSAERSSVSVGIVSFR